MRFSAGLMVVALATAPAMAGLLIGHNPNVNDGGLNMTPPGAWTRVIVSGPDGIYTTAGLDDNRTATPDDGGDWAVGGGDGSGSSPAANSYYYQRFTVASGAVQAGSNDISLSGWSKAWASWWSFSDNWGWLQEARIQLLVDGVMVFDGFSSNNTNRDTWALHQYSGTHNVTNHIEVRLRSIKGNNENGSGSLGAIWAFSSFDDIRLFACQTGSGDCCPNPLGFASITPNAFVIPPAPGVTLFTINGTNLDAVTSLRLFGPFNRNGTIVTQTPTQITATFNLNNNTPAGSYNLELNRTVTNSCSNLIAPGVVTLTCTMPSATVMTITNDRGMHGNPAHKIRLTGINLASLASVVLRKSNFDPGGDIVGTNLTMLGEELEVTFDLTNAEGGRYDVRYATGASCASVTPTAHPKSFLVYMPALANASFEEGYITPDLKTVLCPIGPPDNPKAKHWDDFITGTRHGGGHKRDGHFYGPDCVDGRVKNMTGNHYGGADFIANTPSSWTVFQTIAAPNVNQMRLSTAPFNIRADIAANGGTEIEPVTVKIMLIDGTESDIQQILGEKVFLGSFDSTAIQTSPEYNAIVPQGSQYFSDPPLLTIAFEFSVVGGGATGQGWYGFWIDNVYSGGYVPPSCAGRLVWADNNGDGMVDMLDFAELQLCLTLGSAGPQELPLECACLDRNGDERISDADVVEFIKCATGPAVPWTQDAAPLCVTE